MAEITTEDFFPPRKPKRVTGSADLIALFSAKTTYLNTKQDTVARPEVGKTTDKDGLEKFLQPTDEGKRDDTLWSIVIRLQDKLSPSEL